MSKQAWYNFFNPIIFKNFLEKLKRQYGMRFLLIMLSHYGGVEGAFKAFLDLNETAYYKEAGYPVNINQKAAAISKSPMAMKGFIGLASDLFPFMGYEKSPYMFISTTLGSIAITCLIFIPIDAAIHPFFIPAILFFCCNLKVYSNDILIQGKFAELMKEYPEGRGDIIAYSFMCLNIGALIPAFMVGIAADQLSSPRFTFLLALPFALQTFIFIFTGCMVKDKALPERNNRFDYTKFRLQRPIIVLTLITTSLAFSSLIPGLFFSANISFIYSLATAIISLCGTFIGLPYVIAKVNLYIFCGHVLYLQIQPTIEYFLLADDICVPDGPQFSYTYLKTYVGVVTQFGRFAAVWIYQYILTKLTYRQIFWISSTLRCFGSIFDIMIVMRWNIAIGIEDHYFYLLGHAIIYEITQMLEIMPFTLMIGKICPKNIEVTVFSLIASCANYGATIGVYGGGFVANILGIQTNLPGGKCNFENLAWVIFICNFAIPLFLIPLAFLLTPNNRVGEEIADSSFENSKYLFKGLKFNKVNYDNYTNVSPQITIKE